MQAVIFRTAGKLDLRALTVFGLNAKPNSQNPIGYFGTGLKYAIAVLAREQIPVTIWIGDQRWTIELQPTNFRKRDFNAIFLCRHRKMLSPKLLPLPFTTELGKNWDLWQAYRELASNTIDEQGIILTSDSLLDSERHLGSNLTSIVIESDKFVTQYRNHHKTFLSTNAQPWSYNDEIQVFQQPSHHVYYRGIRILDLEHPSRMTYNILSPLKLTEDRTASEYDVKRAISKHIIQTENKDFVTEVLGSDSKSFEGSLDFDYLYTTPSDTFLDIAATQRNNSTVGAAASRLVKVYRPKPAPKRVTEEDFLNLLMGELDSGTDTEVLVNMIRDRLEFLRATDEIPF